MANRKTSGAEIAVIGVAGRFPGAQDIEAFWQNLVGGKESITFFTDRELRDAGVRDEDLANPDYVKASATLSDVDMFDAEFFRISPREAKFLDPQQRIFLECSWEVMERAGYDTSRSSLRVGVFAGASVSTYMLQNLATHPGAWGADRTPIMFGNAGDFMPTRVSYKLDLTGPSINVQTACSTSLAAVHVACQNLLAGESDMALAGGATIQVPHTAGYLWQPESILSPDGHCRVFDVNAKGTLFGSGVGVVLLKRLEDALRDRDRILAVVLGGAMNNDGASKMGYAAPSIKGQANVITEALSVADVEPETIGYVEAHGTGTVLGDPIELAALAEAFGAGGRDEKCPIGSVKSNVGHLDIAAGIAGFIKTVLALEHGKIPPSLHCDRPNPALRLEQTPFHVNTSLRDWPLGEQPRRAGVSSFGIGGTNVHLVLEEAPPREAAPSEATPRALPELFVLSAKTPAALERATSRLAAHLESNGDITLADAAYTLGVGRQRFDERRCFVASSVADAIAALRSRETADAQRVCTRRSSEASPRLVFMFPGQGCQYPNMALALFRREEAFRADVEHVAALFERASGKAILPLIHGAAGAIADAAAALEAPDVTQLVIFTIEHAMARQLERWGLRPAVLVGHSLGEYAAACMAGVFSLEDAVFAVALRSRLMAETAPGAMLAVALDEASVRAIVGGAVDVAAVNAPSQVVLSGRIDAIMAAESALRARGVEVRRLRVQRANHSFTMDGAVDAFRAGLSKIRFGTSSLPIMSSVTGRWLDPKTAADPVYWASQMRKPVRFGDAVAALAESAGTLFVEVGPGATLSTLARKQGATAVPMLPARAGIEEAHAPLPAMGELWLAGANLDWEAFSGGERRKVLLPTYPFERTRHWVSPAVGGAQVRDESPEPARSEDEKRTASPEDDAAPRTAIETALCSIWQTLLGIDRVGIDDDFHALGGDSLIGTQVVSRVRARLHVEIRVGDLFDAPTPRTLGRVVAERAKVEDTPIVRRTAGVAPTLSFAQERLWFLDRLEPGSGAYNIPSALRLDGTLDADALRRALDEVVRRHEVLRTTFDIDVEGRPLAVVRPSLSIELPRTRLAGTRDERERAIFERARREAAAPFVLNRGPLLRAQLLEIEADEHVLLLTMHHIVADGWSVAVLVREVTVAYRALQAGERVGGVDLPIQYADHAAWQRERLAGPELERQIAYWTKQLEGAPAALELPVDRPRPNAQTSSGAHVTRLVSRDGSNAVDALARRLGATPFMVFFAAYAVLLSRHASQTDLVIGTPIANRTRIEVESLIGMFVNTLALRVDLTGDPSFTELVARVKARTLAAHAHQDLPFERLVEALDVTRDMSRSPVFQTMFALQNAPQEAVEVSDLRVTPLAVETGLAQFDLSVDVIPTREGYRLHWEYNTDLFDGETIERMAARFEELLAGVIAHPDQIVWKLPLLTKEEAQKTLFAWNETSADYPRDATLHGLFEEQVRRTPDAPAIEHRGEVLTYAELEGRANALAKHLGSRSVGRGSIVALRMHRSLDLVVALLAILKSGAAYVPVDPTYPAERIAYMLEDSGARVVVSDEDRLFVGLDVVRVARDAEHAMPRSSSSSSLASATDPAYVLYTSGSTGQPKGVVVEHRSVVNYLVAFGRLTSLAAKDRVLQFVSPSFDVSVEEIFGALLCGATLVLRTDEMLESIESFVAAVAELHVDVLDLPTAYWTELTAGLVRGAKLPPRVRLVVLGGERVDGEIVRQWRTVTSPNVRLLNGYGPTEATIAATFAELGDAQGADVPIGKPVANTVAYVLDPHGNPSPIGVPGELLLGGDCLARGYLNRPELTASKFVANPFGAGRLYRTGDRVRRLPDGNLVFVGRSDDQVKVRGFRIEIGEVEAALSASPGVSEVAVVALGDGGDRQLFAYVVSNRDRGGETERELREHLRARLPEYMIPSIALVSTLPRLPNGKIDRTAFFKPDRRATGAHVAPRTEAEIAMCLIWQEVLGVARVGIEDDFFAVGGSSLLVIRLSVLAKERLGLDLPVSAVMNCPTIAGLAGRAFSRSHLVPLGDVSAKKGQILVFVHALSGEVFPYLEVARRLVDHTVYGLRSPLDDDPAPIRALSELAALHAHALAGLAGPLHLVGWSAGGIIAHEIARQLEALGHPARTLTLLDPPAPGREDSGAPDYVVALLSLLGDRPLPRVADDEADAAVVAASALPCDVETARRLLDRQLKHHRLVIAHEPVPIGTPTRLLSCDARSDLADWTSLAPICHESGGDSHHGMLHAEGAVRLASWLEAHLPRN